MRFTAHGGETEIPAIGTLPLSLFTCAACRGEGATLTGCDKWEERDNEALF